MTLISLVVAASKTGMGIGCGGDLPWRLPEDLKMFKSLTTGPNNNNAVIMGRKTWDSIPAKFRPLPNRLNVVLTRQPTGENSDGNKTSSPYPDNVLVASSVDDAMRQIAERNINNTFVIGGGEIYKTFMDSGKVDEIYLTEVQADEDKFTFDTFFPKLSPSDYDCEDVGGGEKTDEKSGLKYKFLKYTKVAEGADLNPEEMQVRRRERRAERELAFANSE